MLLYNQGILTSEYSFAISIHLNRDKNIGCISKLFIMEPEPHGIGRFMGHFDDKSDSSSIGRLIAKQNAYHMGHIT